MKKVIIALLVIIPFVGCTGPATSDDAINLLKITAEATEYDIESLTEVTGYAFLETSDSCLISTVKKVEKHGSIYFVHAYSALHAFSEEGKHLNSFGKRGRGPGEFLVLKDFAVHSEKDLVLLLTGSPRSVFLFRRNGDFLSSFPVEDRYNEEIEFGDNDEIVLMCDNADGKAEYSFLYYNLEGELIGSRPQYYKFQLTPVDGVWSLGWGQGLLFTDNGKLFTKDAHSDTVYSISGRELVPEYIFNTEEQGFTPEERAVGKPSIQFLRTVWFQHHDKYLIVKAASPEQGSVLLFRNQKRGSDFTVRLTKKPKEDFATARLNEFKSSSDGEFFTHINAVVLKTMILNNPESDDALRKFASAIDENSNPVIVKFKLVIPD